MKTKTMYVNKDPDFIGNFSEYMRHIMRWFDELLEGIPPRTFKILTISETKEMIYPNSIKFLSFSEFARTAALCYELTSKRKPLIYDVRKVYKQERD